MKTEITPLEQFIQATYPQIRTAYDKSVDKGLDFKGEVSLTVQSEKDNCDINLIVEKHAKSGILPIMQSQPQYGDFSTPVDYQTAMNIVNAAQDTFNSLDAKIRKQFDNDPAQFLAFVDDPKNADELLKMGLREAPLPSPIGDTTKETANAAPAA